MAACPPLFSDAVGEPPSHSPSRSPAARNPLRSSLLIHARSAAVDANTSRMVTVRRPGADASSSTRMSFLTKPNCCCTHLPIAANHASASACRELWYEIWMVVDACGAGSSSSTTPPWSAASTAVAIASRYSPSRMNPFISQPRALLIRPPIGMHGIGGRCICRRAGERGCTLLCAEEGRGAHNRRCRRLRLVAPASAFPRTLHPLAAAAPAAQTSRTDPPRPSPAARTHRRTAAAPPSVPSRAAQQTRTSAAPGVCAAWHTCAAAEPTLATPPPRLPTHTGNGACAPPLRPMSTYAGLLPPSGTFTYEAPCTAATFT